MKEFIEANKEISWVVIVVLFTGAMIFFSNWLINLIEKKWKRGTEFNAIFSLLRRIFKGFFILLGVGLLSYLFFEKDAYELINKSLGTTIWIGLVLVLTILGVAIAKNYFSNKISHLSKRDKGDVTAYKYIDTLSTVGIYAMGAILIAIAFPALRNFAASALAGAGVFALVLGVAAQEAFANLIGGLFIVFFKPFRIGDVVRIGTDIVGRVENIDLRQTVINNFQNMRIVIPNSVINKENIVNYYLTEYKTCEWVEIGISYDSDLEKAMQIMQETCETHERVMDNRSDTEKERGMAKVDVQVIKLDDSSVNLKAWVWCADYVSGFRTRNELYKAVKLRFDAEGIEIPFPHRTLVFKNALSQQEQRPRTGKFAYGK